jgi:hypothetical protein
MQALNPGLNADYPVNTRRAARFFKFTVLITPRNINPGNLDIETAQFPTQTTANVYLRMLLDNTGEMHPTITKHLTQVMPKMLIPVY